MLNFSLSLFLYKLFSCWIPWLYIWLHKFVCPWRRSLFCKLKILACIRTSTFCIFLFINKILRQMINYGLSLWFFSSWQLLGLLQGNEYDKKKLIQFIFVKLYLFWLFLKKQNKKKRTQFLQFNIVWLIIPVSIIRNIDTMSHYMKMNTNDVNILHRKKWKSVRELAHGE